MNKLIVFLFILISSAIYAQDTTVVNKPKQFRIVLFDEHEFFGTILEQNAREILLLCSDNRKIYIPQYEIKDMEALEASDYNQNGDYVGEDVFATRYFISTNGLNIPKGEHYVQWNLYGPDFQFAVTDRLGIGVMTSWLATPIVLNAKYAFPTKGKFNCAVGGLLGTGSWGAPDWGMALPFVSIGYGDRKTNLSLSGGFGAFMVRGDKVNHPMVSMGFLTKLSKRFSIVFDGFFVLPAPSEYVKQIESVYDPATQTTTQVETEVLRTHPGIAAILPGLRWNVTNNKAFQFGFSGIYAEGEFMRIPIPMVQWFRKL